jgi:Uma2 family endonuclease
MATTLERPTPPARRRLDIDTYYRMAEVGILTPADRVELIDGEIIDMAPIGSEHAGKTNRLNRLLAQVTIDGIALVSIQSPLRLDAYNEPQPDLMLLRPRADDYQGGHPTATDVLLLVEVAGTSLAYDRGTKLGLYAHHGIPEVWIVDLDGKVVEVCREPESGSYRSRKRLTEGQLTPAMLPALAVDLATLLA